MDRMRLVTIVSRFDYLKELKYHSALVANGLLGVQNTMNAVAAIDDIITMSRCCGNRNAKNNTKVAAAVCHR